MAAHGLGEVKVDQCITAQHNKGVVEKLLEILNFFKTAG